MRSDSPSIQTPPGFSTRDAGNEAVGPERLPWRTAALLITVVSALCWAPVIGVLMLLR